MRSDDVIVNPPFTRAESHVECVFVCQVWGDPLVFPLGPSLLKLVKCLSTARWRRHSPIDLNFPPWRRRRGRRRNVFGAELGIVSGRSGLGHWRTRRPLLNRWPFRIGALVELVQGKGRYGRGCSREGHAVPPLAQSLVMEVGLFVVLLREVRPVSRPRPCCRTRPFGLFGWRRWWQPAARRLPVLHAIHWPVWWWQPLLLWPLLSLHVWRRRWSFVVARPYIWRPDQRLVVDGSPEVRVRH